MKYKNIIPGTFLCRPNRFIAKVLVQESNSGVTTEETVHVKNTGRCKELLISGCTVFLSVSDNPLRKTKYDLIGVIKEREGKLPLMINLDSQIPNDVVAEWLQKGNLFSKDVTIRREVTYHNSRFDFYIEDGSTKAFLEVKGVTLEKDGIAMFPDAPTERGIKHIEELIACTKDGYDAYIVFVIQMKDITSFCPNDATHAAFGNALRIAKNAGVKILAFDCIVTENSIVLDKQVNVNLA